MSDHLILVGDARRIPLADESVHCVVTSPPYFGLRDYRTEGQVGLEDSPDEYVAVMVAVMREVRRVLRDDGTLWLNLGDSYGGVRGNRSPAPDSKNPHSPADTPAQAKRGTARKNLLGIPWRVALALQDDGWLLRSDIVWNKPNAMPESVRDRPSRAHETVFLMTKRPRYYYDGLAVEEKSAQPSGTPKLTGQVKAAHLGKCTSTSKLGANYGSPRRACRSVWTLNTRPYKGAHFAVMPPKLAERCIRAGTSEQGVCPACDSPWRRIVQRSRAATRPGTDSKVAGLEPIAVGNRDPLRHVTATLTIGWEPSCGCDAGDPVPAVVFDPFSGAATTGVAAVGLGRRYVGLELNPDYAAMGHLRISRPHAPAKVMPAKAAPTPLFPDG